MKRLLKSIVFLLASIGMGCEPGERKNLLIQVLEDNPEYFSEILQDPEKYRIQIIYTRISRDENNVPVFTDYTYRLNRDEYFYPASTVKLPIAALAMEKINELNIDSLSIYSTMLTDSAYSGQTRMTLDSSSQDLKPSIAHYIKKIFLVSDNDAFNRLYEFLGQQYINESLHRKGYQDIRITHRLSIPLSVEENRYTNPVRFLRDSLLIHKQDLVYNPMEIASPKPIFLGEGHISNDSLINEPMDFSGKNFIPLRDLHEILKSIVFPEHVDPFRRFFLTEEDYRFLYKFMSMYPRESNFPDYGNEYEDNYCKFLMFGDREGQIPENFRVFNKIGLAYGFLVETAYIVDFSNNVEFILSAVISVNRNTIYNDGNYEYDETGFPFMGHLGRAVYEYEKNRNRENKPDLSRFRISYEQ